MLLTNYALKVGWEAVMTPFTYRIVNFLKRAEHEDYFDRNTDFTPFSPGPDDSHRMADPFLALTSAPKRGTRGA